MGLSDTTPGHRCLTGGARRAAARSAVSLFQLFDKVHVEIAGDAHTAVTQPLAHRQQGNPSGETSGGGPVTEPVERDDRQPGTPGSPLKGPQDEVGVEATTVFVGEERATAPYATRVPWRPSPVPRTTTAWRAAPRPNCKPLASFVLTFAVPASAGPSPSVTKIPLEDGPFRN